MHTLCEEINKQISLLLDEKAVNKLIWSIDELKKADSQLREVVNTINNILEKQITAFSRNNFEIYAQENEKILDVLKQLKSSISELNIDNYINLDIANFSLPEVSDVFMKTGISQEEYKRSEHFLKTLIEEIVKMRNKKREEKKDLEQSLLSRILQFRLPAFTSTLTIFITNFNNQLRYMLQFLVTLM